MHAGAQHEVDEDEDGNEQADDGHRQAKEGCGRGCSGFHGLFPQVFFNELADNALEVAIDAEARL